MKREFEILREVIDEIIKTSLDSPVSGAGRSILGSLIVQAETLSVRAFQHARTTTTMVEA